MLFCEYYDQWIDIYKVGSITKVTLKKYRITSRWLKKIAPALELEKMKRIDYQNIINKFAETHERQTVKDFNTQLKASLVDAYDEGIIERNPANKVVIKGVQKTRNKKHKFLSLYELKKLISVLELGDELNYDHIIYLIAKTGIRFAEAVGLTRNDFDFEKRIIDINKTLDYKDDTGFAKTKNYSSIRRVSIDEDTCQMFDSLLDGIENEVPIFRQNARIYNSTVNKRLKKKCEEAGITIISLHGLRHTHASLLLFQGVSIASVAKRLGHADMTTTQSVYLHVVQELEEQDDSLVMKHLKEL